MCCCSCFSADSSIRHCGGLDLRHVFFFFKQKTAYEILACWSSDVCSSDLLSLVRQNQRSKLVLKEIFLVCCTGDNRTVVIYRGNSSKPRMDMNIIGSLHHRWTRGK